MVRSNFDYTNRTSSGERLGASIAGDFWKKAAQAVKTVKPKGTSRKSVNAADADAAAAATAAAGTTTITGATTTIAQTRFEIKIPDKKLTDEGFRLIAEALTAALKARPDLTLVALDISGNDLTINAVRGLTEVLKNAPDMQHLNLSSNNISVVTESDCVEWLRFAATFCGSENLQHLDLSHNKHLGPRCWEVSMRAVSQGTTSISERNDSHQHDDPTDLSVSGLTLACEPHELMLDAPAATPSRSVPARKSMNGSPAKRLPTGKILTVVDTGMNDHGALFACAITRRTETWDKPFELIWTKEESAMSKTGMELFELTETNAREVKKSKLQTTTVGDDSPNEDASGGIESPLASPSPAEEGRARAVSLSKRFSTNQEVSEELQLERTIKKIQRNTIDLAGYKSVELWTAGLAVFQISRKVYVLAPRRVEHEPEEAPDGQATSGGAANQTMDDLIAEFGYPLERQTPVGSPSLYEAFLPPRPSTPEDSPDSSPSPSKSGKTWAATAVSTPVDYSTDFSSPFPGPGGAYNEPVWIKEQPRSNKQLRRLKRNANLSKSFDMGNRSQSPDTTSTSSPLVSDIARRLAMSRSGRELDRLALRPITSVAYQEWQVEHMKKLQVQQEGASNGYSDKSLRCQLPLTVCQRILSFAMPEDMLSILSERQQKKAFEWGQLHDSLSTEYDWRTRDESSQIWMLLESIDCLEYD